MQRILVVEDDPNLRLLYEEELAEDGFTVDAVASGEEAIEAIQTAGDGTYDAVVLDIRLGGIDGLEAMRRILLDRPRIAVVLNSAYAGFKSDFASWAADAYIVKSSDLTELKAELHGVLDKTAAASAR